MNNNIFVLSRNILAFIKDSMVAVILIALMRALPSGMSNIYNASTWSTFSPRHLLRRHSVHRSVVHCAQRSQRPFRRAARTGVARCYQRLYSCTSRSQEFLHQ